MKMLSVIIPVYNEEQTLEEIVRRVQQAPFPLEKELLIVNDASAASKSRIADHEALINTLAQQQAGELIADALEQEYFD